MRLPVISTCLGTWLCVPVSCRLCPGRTVHRLLPAHPLRLLGAASTTCETGSRPLHVSRFKLKHVVKVVARFVTLIVAAVLQRSKCYMPMHLWTFQELSENPGSATALPMGSTCLGAGLACHTTKLASGYTAVKL